MRSTSFTGQLAGFMTTVQKPKESTKLQCHLCGHPEDLGTKANSGHSFAEQDNSFVWFNCFCLLHLTVLFNITSAELIPGQLYMEAADPQDCMMQMLASEILSDNGYCIDSMSPDAVFPTVMEILSSHCATGRSHVAKVEAKSSRWWSYYDACSSLIKRWHTM
jgi:hypothetical protein